MTGAGDGLGLGSDCSLSARSPIGASARRARTGLTAFLPPDASALLGDEAVMLGGRRDTRRAD